MIPCFGRYPAITDVQSALLDTEAAVAFLADLAGTGPVLELAIGTGRIALPIAERGVEVCGIDASEKMVSHLRAKPGGATIPVSFGDFADVAIDGRYTLVCVVFNTLFALQTQEVQIRCFENVAAHLADEGVFVVEASVTGHIEYTRERAERVAQAYRAAQRALATFFFPLISLIVALLLMGRAAERAEASATEDVGLGVRGLARAPNALRTSFPVELVDI